MRVKLLALISAILLSAILLQYLYLNFSVNLAEFKRPDIIPPPDDPPLTPEQRIEMIKLGRLLFFDPRLSRSGLMSCATCHNPSFYWTDSLPVSVENETRRSMSLFNLAWDPYFTWLGAKGSIASQILLPLVAVRGMGSNDEIIAKLFNEVSEYRDSYDRAMHNLCGQIKCSPDLVGVGIIIAQYVRTLLSPTARFDRWIEGDKNALSEDEIAGFKLFTGKARCSQCHAGWRFSDGKVYDIGIKFSGFIGDAGWAERAQLKAVGLRNIADRPPYMHDGSFKTLAEVIDFYDRGGDVDRPTKSEHIKPLKLTDLEKKQLELFLRSLSGPMEPVSFPILPRK